MIFSKLKIHHLRNIHTLSLSLNSRFNFIIGPNGSGKTTILEALYLLSCGHSFRSRETRPLISFDQDSFTVFALSTDNQTVSIRKSKSTQTHIKLNDQFCRTTSQLAYETPCQVCYSDLFQIIDAGPSVRRAVLDWGLFHVKPNYLILWNDYKKVLRQRNALLKKERLYSHFIPWDMQLSRLAKELDELRSDYTSRWQEAFNQVLPELSDVHCTFSYYRGWDRKDSGANLDQLLKEQFESDKHRQFTQSGAHQADLIIEGTHLKAKQVLSRGQQKIILLALKLAQGKLLDNNCLYLFDDLASELDEKHLCNLFNYLQRNPGQFVITGINAAIDVQDNKALYQLDNGMVSYNP